MGWVWEIRRCKLAVVSFRSAVVGFGSCGFVSEAAERYWLAVDLDLCLPGHFTALSGDAFIF